jgi:hypothetical protein
MNVGLGRPLRRKEASEYLKRRWGIDRAASTLAKLAVVGGGPKFQHAGRIPLYPIIELDAWASTITSALKSSTSDKPNALNDRSTRRNRPQDSTVNFLESTEDR